MNLQKRVVGSAFHNRIQSGFDKIFAKLRLVSNIVNINCIVDNDVFRVEKVNYEAVFFVVIIFKIDWFWWIKLSDSTLFEFGRISRIGTVWSCMSIIWFICCFQKINHLIISVQFCLKMRQNSVASKYWKLTLIKYFVGFTWMIFTWRFCDFSYEDGYWK